MRRTLPDPSGIRTDEEPLDMTSLLALALVLLVIWTWAQFERDRRAAFMRTWIHVPFVGGVMALVMALGLWIR